MANTENDIVKHLMAENEAFASGAKYNWEYAPFLGYRQAVRHRKD